MSVTYGFYNAVNHDRLYNAIQMSQLFDGIIQNGVFSTIGDALVVTPQSGMNIKVGEGRAWFNHTWTLNDADLVLTVPSLASIIMSRIDAVVLEVDSSLAVRANTIKIISGTEATAPVKPTLVHTAEVNQYALAYITIPQGATEIKAENIENVVGTDETPFVTGVLQQVSIETLLQNWATRYEEWIDNFESTNETAFNEWFDNLRYVLDGDVAGHLQNEIESTMVNYTLLSTNWDSNNRYMIESNHITATSNQEVLPALSANITDDQLKALNKANFQDGGQEPGKMYIVARGNVPLIDIPVRIIFRGIK